MRVKILEKLPILHTGASPSCSLICKLADDDVTSSRKTLCNGNNKVARTDSNISNIST